MSSEAGEKPGRVSGEKTRKVFILRDFNTIKDFRIYVEWKGDYVMPRAFPNLIFYLKNPLNQLL